MATVETIKRFRHPHITNTEPPKFKERQALQLIGKAGWTEYNIRRPQNGGYLDRYTVLKNDVVPPGTVEVNGNITFGVAWNKIGDPSAGVDTQVAYLACHTTIFQRQNSTGAWEWVHWLFCDAQNEADNVDWVFEINYDFYFYK
jgi:hypothetical protein